MKAPKTSEEVAGSCQDPGGFLFWRHGSIYRQVNLSYKENHEHLVNSVLYEALVADGLLVAHEEVGEEAATSAVACKQIMPQLVPFISHPH
jgi:hypothetical protein